MTKLHITLLPEEVFFRLLPFLDLPDQHSLLLTCRSLFYKVVPALYRSPFRLLLAYNGKTSPHPLSPTSTSSPSTFPPIASASASYSYSSIPSYSTASDPSSLIPTSSTLYSTIRTTITPATATLTTVRVARSNSSINSNSSSHGAGNGIGSGAGGSGNSMRHSSRRHTSNPNSLRKASASSVSSTSTSSTSSSSTHTAATALTTAASSYSPPSARPTGTSGPFPAAIATATASTSAPTSATPRSVRPSSLHQRSLSDHPKGFNPSSIGTSHSDTTTAHSKARLSIITHHNQQQQSSSTRSMGTATTMALTPQRDGWKLKKMSQLLQLLIACTSIQARLPALRYPGYGQQWIRPPCKLDYLLYYTDQQEGGEIMVQCFHLLFADLIQCRWENEARGLGVPLGPPDKEAYKVLYQIQREFMAHHPAGIRTLSVSAVHTIDHAITLAPQLGRVSRLELTDLELEFKVEKVVDFIKSHRMVFGPVLKELSLKKTQTEGETRGDSGANSPGSRGAGGGYQASISAASMFSFGSASSPISSTPTFPPQPTSVGIIAATGGGGGGGGGVPSSSTSPPVALIQSLVNFPRSAATSSMASSVMSVVEAIKGLERLDATNWDDCVLYLDRLPSPSLKRLWLSPNTPSSTSPNYTQAEQQLMGLAEQLKKWRQLEEIKMPIRKGNVFAWAASEKRAALICAPILAGSRTKRLPEMRQIHLEGPTLDVVDSVRDAAFAFQTTLEDLEARSRVRVWHPTTIEWGWRMPRLTRLTLEGEISLYFSLDALNRCPALEELTLATSMRHQHHHYRQDQPPLSPLPHLARGTNPGGDLLLFIRSQEIRSIASLKNLQRLSLHGAWQVPDRVLRRIADHCLKLKELRLDQTVGTTIGGVLLGVENMERLEKLELRLDVVDLSLVRIVARKLAFLSSIQLTSLRTID
ncbi:hypothetical protein EC957_010757 [Mortierella hygrophila]|uniref:F-box domain-containing protein n=1 Tax=Mortierella hygrophila TaxID=979708 RepID=A0A9P6K7S3_9FUNG|nr:hypothetical protein EC957_010757 [Mortierella hygrophila]